MTATTELFAQARALSPKWSIATDGLDAAQRQTILDRMRAISYDPRAILFDQGEPSDTLLLVTEGQVRLFQTLDNGEEFTFGVRVPGAILGLAATVTGQPRILSAQALEPATASIMTRDDFPHCLQAIPRFHWNITRLPWRSLLDREHRAWRAAGAGQRLGAARHHPGSSRRGRTRAMPRSSACTWWG